MKALLERLIRCNKGIAEIVGSLVLILIVTAAGVIVYAYSVNVMSSSSSNYDLQTTQSEQQAQERFEAVRVWLNSPNQLNLTILNYGKTDLTIDAVYINSTKVTQFTSGRAVTIGIGQLVNVKFTSPLAIQTGSSVEVLVVSQRGGKSTVFFKA